jgi:predicted nucleic acid-binding protein
LITLDTGALVAIERRRLRARAILEAAWAYGLRVTIPAAAWGEWHAGRPRHGLGRFSDAVVIEPLTAELAELAGRALAALRLPSTHFVDAAVMATAALRGDVVYTSDFDDLQRLAAHFRSVRVFSV